MRSGLLNNIGIYTVANIAVAVIPFLLLPVLTRILTPEEYGIVAMFGIGVSAFGALTGLGTLGAVEVRYFELKRQALGSYISGCFLILLVSALILAIGTWATSGLLSDATSVPPDWLMASVAVSAMQFVIQIRLTLWQSGNRPRAYALMQVSQSALNAFLSLIFVIILHMAWRGRTLGICISSLLVSTAAVVSLYKDGWLSNSPRIDQIKDSLRFGIPLIPHTLGGLLITTIDRIIITHLLGVSSTGVYMVALQIGMAVSLITGAGNKAFAPWLFGKLRESSSQMRARIVRVTYSYFAILILLALVVGLGAPTLLGILVGESYRAASNIVIYITIGYAFGGMYYMVTNYVFWAGATGRLAIVSFTSGLTNVLLSIWAINTWGLEGVGISFMLSQALLFIGTLALSQKVYPMPWIKAIFQKIC